jgi:esterase/lipase superfamily enzyme
MAAIRTIMNARFISVLAIALAVGIAVATVEAQRREIRGRITDTAGAGRSGVSVDLVKDGATIRSTVSGADGRFRLDIVELSEGTFDVRIVVPGFAPQVIRLTPNPQPVVASVDGLRIEVRADTLATAAPGGPPPPPPPPPPPTEAPDPRTHAVVPVFYATDRNRLSYTPLSYGGERDQARQLHLGRIDVSVPRDHQRGQVERPTIWTLWREDPNKHFVIVNAAEQPYDEFYRQLRDVVGKSQRKEAFVFVHGYNVAFESAVYRTGQIAYDLGFDGAPILYSWPSLGDPAKYFEDQNNSEWTTDHLHWFLEDVAAKTGAEYIHVIGHSRGNGPLMQALKAIAVEPRHAPLPKFRQIVLTAPDVDADAFRLLAQAFGGIAERTTLYASANDKALLLSKRFQGYQRAGDVNPRIVVMPGLDSIDVSAVDTSFLGHSYVGDNTSVISDIARLLRSGVPPSQRCGLQPSPDPAFSYWTFIARAFCPAIGAP